MAGSHRAVLSLPLFMLAAEGEAAACFGCCSSIVSGPAARVRRAQRKDDYISRRPELGQPRRFSSGSAGCAAPRVGKSSRYVNTG